MLNHLSELKKASLFYFIVMALSLALVMFFRLVAPKSEIVMPANMLTPALAAVIMLYVLTSDGYKRKGPFSLGLFTLVTRAGAEPALGLLPGPRLSVGNLLLAAFRGAGSDCRYYGDSAETALSDDNPCAPRDPERG